MRRRMDVNVVPDRLLPAALPVFEDDYSLPVRDRFVAHERWMSEYEAWVRARDAWAARHGWPGGDEVRLVEQQAVVIPDAPFDLSSI